ncbi:zinc-binding dehydrogenase [Streptomyces sp. NPDC054796]
MLAVVRETSGQVRVAQVADPVPTAPGDVVVRVVLAAVCGTDLWGFRGFPAVPPGPRAGHEFVGVVEDTGGDVRTLRRGDMVLAPFWWADGTCRACQEGLPSSCPRGGMWGGEHDGGQGEAVRVPFADATLVRLPLTEDDERLPAVLTLADTMATGTHAALSAGVAPGSSVAVVGDGAVGLCAVLAARRAGAEQVVLLGQHAERVALGEEFGATHVVREADEAGRAEVRELTGGHGTRCVLECAGTQRAVDTALDVVADGGAIALAGAPHGALNDLSPVFLRNLTVSGGLAPARALIPPLLDDVLSGRLDPSPVFDLTVRLDEAPEAYEAMASRTALKALIRR